MTYIVGPPFAGGLPGGVWPAAGGGGLRRGVACGLRRGVVACGAGWRVACGGGWWPAARGGGLRRGVACGLPGVVACRDGGEGWRVVWW